MQVNQADEHITHAVISKAKPIAFRISQNAEFFQVLFQSLYKHPREAAIRETLCNAWDAHIAAGKTDIPLDVTINEHEFIVRDFGGGIPAEDMEERYCVLGDSTKVNSEEETGGFGLGCKAPFAITDNFEVTSMAGGVKTIYTLSRSAGMVKGVPSCTPVVSLPCPNESGLIVKIPIITAAVQDITAIAQRAIYGGGIFAKINGVEVEQLPLKTSGGNWAITRTNPMVIDNHAYRVSNNIFVRYGTVVYPGADLAEHMPAEYKSLLGFLKEFAQFIAGTSYDKCLNLVIQAEKGTLSLTPSRETLSMVPRTIQSLQEIFKNVYTDIIENTTPVAFEEIKEIAESAAKSRDVRSLTCIPFLPAHPGVTTASDNAYDDGNSIRRPIVSANLLKTMGNHITDVSVLGKNLIFNKSYYKRVPGLQKEDINARIRFMIENQILDRGTLQTFRVAFNKKRLDHWFRHRIVGRLMAKMQAHPHLDPNKLLVPFVQPYEKLALLDAKGAILNDTLERTHYLAFARKIVILSPTKEMIQLNMEKLPCSRQIGGYNKKSLVYITGRDPEHITSAELLFRKHGYVIIDLNEHHPWMVYPVKAAPSPVKTKVPTSPRKPKVGYVSLDQVLKIENGAATIIPMQRIANTGARLTNPKGVLKLKSRSYGDSLWTINGFDLRESVKAIRLFGSQIGVVASGDSLDVALKKGIEPGERYILQTLMDEMVKNKNIQSYLPHVVIHGVAYQTMSDNDQKFLSIIMRWSPKARRHFGLEMKMEEKDWNIVDLFHTLTRRNYNDFSKVFGTPTCPVMSLAAQCRKLSEQTSKPMTDILAWISNNQSKIRMLELARIKQELVLRTKTKMTLAQKFNVELAEQLLLTILKGK